MPKFSVHVVLMGPDFRPASFGPGDEVPEWATVGEHVLAADDAAPESAPVESEPESGDDPEPDPVPDEAPDFTAPPPRRNTRSRK